MAEHEYGHCPKCGDFGERSGVIRGQPGGKRWICIRDECPFKRKPSGKALAGGTDDEDAAIDAAHEQRRLNRGVMGDGND